MSTPYTEPKGLPGCFYVHKKTGKVYKALCFLAVRGETGEWVPGLLYQRVEDGVQYAQSRLRFDEAFDHACDCLAGQNAAGPLPWSDLKVAFDATQHVWNLTKDDLPKGWSLVATDMTGARCVAIFRVEGVPTVADGDIVAAAIERLKP